MSIIYNPKKAEQLFIKKGAPSECPINGKNISKGAEYYGGPEENPDGRVICGGLVATWYPKDLIHPTCEGCKIRGKILGYKQLDFLSGNK